MSGDALKQFLQKIESEPQLQDELSKLLGKSGGTSMSVGDFAGLAAQHGFEIEEGDLAEHHVKTSLDSEELETVVGGMNIGVGELKHGYSIQLENATVAGLRDIKLVNATMKGF